MHALAIQLINTNKVRLAVATSYLGDKMQTHYDDKISYYILPRKRDLTKYDRSLETYWIKVVEEFNPDVIHIHGTEYTHGLCCMVALLLRKTGGTALLFRKQEGTAPVAARRLRG